MIEGTVSVVVPVYNEEGNLVPLHRELRSALPEAEFVFVNDGSTDGSGRELDRMSVTDRRMKVVEFTRNFGQTAAIAAGVERSGGETVVLMDADGQNDPADIPLILKRLDDGYDVVSGWRRTRHDPFWTKVFPSLIANRVIAWISGVSLHDFGCTLKAYRRGFLHDAALYGEMHRLLPLYAAMRGARIAELPVSHRPRRSGRSKYNLTRTYKVLLDLVTVKFLSGYLSKPIYVFGGVGGALMGLGVLAGGFTLVEKYRFDWLGYAETVYVHRNPKILLAIFLFILGGQFLMLGLLAEVVIRAYYGARGERPYVVRRTVNLDDGSSG